MLVFEVTQSVYSMFGSASWDVGCMVYVMDMHIEGGLLLVARPCMEVCMTFFLGALDSQHMKEGCLFGGCIAL